MDAKKIKFISAGIVIVLLGIVIFQNFEDITVKILMARIRMPVALLLLMTFAIGGLAGWILPKFIPSKKKKPEEQPLDS